MSDIFLGSNSTHTHTYIETYAHTLKNIFLERSEQNVNSERSYNMAVVLRAFKNLNREPVRCLNGSRYLLPIVL